MGNELNMSTTHKGIDEFQAMIIKSVANTFMLPIGLFLPEITKEGLMFLTENMPMKTIAINGKPYLERYFIQEDEQGRQHWLHRFLRNDSERHVHSHPWDAVSHVLFGSYTEQVREADGSMSYHTHRAKGTNSIPKNKLHRIVEVEQYTWTYMIVEPSREEEWFFIDDNDIKTPVKSSPTDWYKNCKTRSNT